MDSQCSKQRSGGHTVDSLEVVEEQPHGHARSLGDLPGRRTQDATRRQIGEGLDNQGARSATTGSAEVVIPKTVTDGQKGAWTDTARGSPSKACGRQDG